jgi:hypothetical protein
MGTGLQAKLEIPDLWYDVYARFLPGTLFSFAIRYIILKLDTIPTGTEIIIYVGAGYISALFTQSIASFFTAFLEKKITIKKKKDDRFQKETKDALGSDFLWLVFSSKMDRLFIRRVQKILGTDTRSSMILSKMGAEVPSSCKLLYYLWFSFIIITLVQCDRPLVFNIFPLITDVTQRRRKSSKILG